MLPVHGAYLISDKRTYLQKFHNIKLKNQEREQINLGTYLVTLFGHIVLFLLSVVDVIDNVVKQSKCKGDQY